MAGVADMARRRFVDELLEVLEARCPSASPAERREFERDIRQRWGGDRVYIDKATAAGKAQRLGAALAAGASLREAIEKAGLSRRSGYRVLSKKWVIK